MRMEKARPGKYVGELRQRFHTIEQWDGQEWREPPETGWTPQTIQGSGRINFDVADAMHHEDAADLAFRPR